MDKKTELDRNVTSAKAVSIILMVLCHADVSLALRSFIATFHMPLFFFYAGYCLKEKYFLHPFEFVRRRINGLYLPFVKWGLFFLLLHNILFRLNIYNEFYGLGNYTSRLYTLGDFCKRGLLVITAMRGEERMIGAYWFLHDLFFCSLIAFLIFKVTKSAIWGAGIILCITIIAYWENISIPYWEINPKVMLGATFFAIGRLFKTYYLMDRILKDRRVFCFFISFAFVVIGTYANHVSMFEVNFNNLLLYVVCATAGTVWIHIISFYLLKNRKQISKILNFIGEHTMTILTWHFSSFKIISVSIILIYHLDVRILAQHPTIIEYSEKGWWMLYTLVGIGVPCVTAQIRAKIKGKVLKAL